MFSRSQTEARAANPPGELPEGIYPASLAQRLFWVLDQLQAPTSAYNVHTGLWLYGPLDTPALRSSLQAVVDRHETLRTCFRLIRDELLQIVVPEVPISMEIKDFTGESDPYPPAYKLACAEVAKAFDLSRGPLIRALLMRIHEEENVLLCTMHHAITDAWSLQLFVRELSSLYESMTKGRPATLPELPIQYGDYSTWQGTALNAEGVQDQLTYWENKLKDSPKLLELPHDGPRPSEQSLEGASRTYEVPGEIMASMKTLAGRSNATLFTILLAAFKILLYRYSGQPDLLVGVPVAGRNQVETEQLIGFFVDTLVLRDDLSGNPSFLQVVASVRETTLAAFANADVPFDKVVERLQPERDLSYNPIFQVMFSLIKSAIRSHKFADLSAYPYVVNANSSILDLFASFIEDSDGKWWLQFDFNTRLFGEERIVRMRDDFIALLQAIVADPHIRIDDISVPNAPQNAFLLKRAQAARQAAQTSGNGHNPTPSFVRHSDFEPREINEEMVLTEIWKDVLGLPRVGLHENFFDLGGHSLLGARLIRQVQDATGRKLPVSAIFRAPTIESFAALLRQQSTISPDPIFMKLRSGAESVAFFAVVAPGVDSLGYGLLARHLGREQAMYKLQGPGPMVMGRPFGKEELRTMARTYIDAMHSVQPRGPYCLGAMCGGVQIAQQMILELEAQGEEIALFAIFDTWVLENAQIRSLWTIHYYMWRLRGLRYLPTRQKFAAVRKVFRGRARALIGFPNGAKDAPDWNHAYWPDNTFQQPRFQAPILLFKRPRQPYFYIRDPQMGWGARSMGGVEICDVKCRHYEVLRPPFVRAIGAKLQTRLEEINRKAKVRVAA